MNKEELLHHRMLKFRHIGGFQEGMPVAPERKRNMKPSEVNKPKTDDIERELENLKRKILESKTLYEPISSQAIEKLKQDLDKEITNAFISMGLQVKIESVKLELSKAPPNQPLNHNLKEKVEKVMLEFKQNLSRPGAYLGLKQKLEQLSVVSKLIELKKKHEKLRVEINEKVTEGVKSKMEVLSNAKEKMLKEEQLSKELTEEVEKAKEDVVEFLKSSGLEIVGVTKRNAGTTPPPPIREKISDASKEIVEEIKKAVNAAGLNDKVEQLKTEIARSTSSEKVEKLQAEVKEGILAALDTNGLKEKFENLRLELLSSSSVTSTEIDEDKVGAENGRL